MSRENVDVVRASFEAFLRRDLDAFLSCFDPEVEFRSLVLEVEGAYHGHEGLRAWWDGLLRVFPDWKPQLEDTRDLGQRVLSRARAGGHGTGSGIPLEWDFWHLAEIRDGRIKLSAFFRTEHEALEAAGQRVAPPGPRSMTLVDGVHHLTFLTEDLDRLLAFYVRVFGAEVTLDMTEEGLRHAFLKVGPTTVLHPFQMLEGPGPPAPSPMFSRGRLDHFALLAPSEEAFRELRRRIEAEGAADGAVRDMGALWIMGYFDPDGAAHEVILQRPGFADSDMLERADWTTVRL